MSQEQREYTIKKVEKNKQEIESLEKSLGINGFTFGFAGMVILGSLGIVDGLDFIPQNVSIAVYSLIGSMTIAGIGALARLVQNVAKKANLEVMTEQLVYDLSMDSLDNENKANETEEAKGRTR